MMELLVCLEGGRYDRAGLKPVKGAKYILLKGGK